MEIEILYLALNVRVNVYVMLQVSHEVSVAESSSSVMSSMATSGSESGNQVRTLHAPFLTAQSLRTLVKLITCINTRAFPIVYLFIYGHTLINLIHCI